VATIDGLLVPADHQTVAALQAPDPAACAAVEVVKTLWLEALGAAAVVSEVRVAPVNDRVARLHQIRKLVNHFVRDGRRHHDPRVAGDFELRNELLQRRRWNRPFLRQLAHRRRVRIINDAGVSITK